MTKLYKKTDNLRNSISILVDSTVNQINTALLAKVASVASGSDKIELEILSKRSYIDKDNNRQYIKFDNINLRLAYQKGFIPTTKVGDYGFVIVMQSDIEVFLSGEEDSPRKYDILDGIFIPMQYATANTTNLMINSSSGEDINITSGKNIVVNSTNTTFNNTHFSVSNGVNELVDLLGQLSGVCAGIAVDTQTGVLLGGITAQFSNLQSKFEAFKP